MHQTMGGPGPWLQPLESGLETLSSIIDLIGIAIVLWGFGRALIAFLRAELRRFTRAEGLMGVHRVRLDLGTYILVGIEFMIASDIINTVDGSRRM